MYKLVKSFCLAGAVLVIGHFLLIEERHCVCVCVCVVFVTLFKNSYEPGTATSTKKNQLVSAISFAAISFSISLFLHTAVRQAVETMKHKHTHTHTINEI